MHLIGMDNPELGPDTLTARPYQIEAIDAVRREHRSNRSTLVILPTGTGKTVLFSKLSRAVVEEGGRVLVLAHRGELIEQAANVLERVGIVAGIEKAESYARGSFDPDVVVATVQTMQRQRLESWPRDHFRLAIVDEAHHATATTYQRVLNHFDSAKILGLTATPDRADEDEIASVFDSVAYEMTIWDAMTAPAPGPYLCRLKFVQCDVGIDLRGIRTTGGDFNQADLEERITPLIGTLANAIRQEIGDRRTLVFTPDVGSATAMATAMQSIGLRADWVSGESADRKDKIARYKSGDIQILTNCALLTEGFDAPETAAVVLCRPTKSRALFAQQVGRGTRLSPGKADCLLIDFNYLTDKHDLVRPADLFDSTQTDTETMEIADEILKQAPGQDLLDVIEKARKVRDERRIVRIRAMERTVKYRKVSYDPLAIADTLGVVMRGAKSAVLDPPSQRQIDLMNQFGVSNPESLSRRRASRLLDVMLARSRAGLASPKQTSWLIAEGVDPQYARSLTKKEASKTLGEIFEQKKRRRQGNPKPQSPPTPDARRDDDEEPMTWVA